MAILQTSAVGLMILMRHSSCIFFTQQLLIFSIIVDNKQFASQQKFQLNENYTAPLKTKASWLLYFITKRYFCFIFTIVPTSLPCRLLSYCNIHMYIYCFRYNAVYNFWLCFDQLPCIAYYAKAN